MGQGQFEVAPANGYIKDPRGFSHLFDDTRSAPEKERCFSSVGMMAWKKNNMSTMTR